MKITAIDFETANTDPASICAVGISVYDDGVLEEPYYTLIRPEANVGRFLYGNVMIHGIHPEDVEDAPDFDQVYKEILPYFEDAIVCAHNANFDMGCLRAACLNTGKKVPLIEYFDTLRLSRMAFPYMPHHRLNDMCELMKVKLDHHNASSDANGCLMIPLYLMKQNDIWDIRELLNFYHTPIREL